MYCPKFKIHLIIMFLLIIFSCEKDDDKIMTFTVAPCKGVYSLPFGPENIMGYTVTDSENKTFTIDNINGFEDVYEEGYEYVIVVKAVERNKSKKPAEDAFITYSYYLIKIISKEKKEADCSNQ